MTLGATQSKKVYDSVLYVFSLIVDSKWHLWDTLIKQFFLLLRPSRYFKQIFFYSFVFTFFCLEDPGSLLWSTASKQTETERSVLNMGCLAASWEPSKSVNQIYCWSDFRNLRKVCAHCSWCICQITAPVGAPAQDEFQVGELVQE